MSDSNWRKTDGRARDRVNELADAHGNSSGDEHTTRYGDEAGVWTSVVWAVIGINSPYCNEGIGGKLSREPPSRPTGADTILYWAPGLSG